MPFPNSMTSRVGSARVCDDEGAILLARSDAFSLSRFHQLAALQVAQAVMVADSDTLSEAAASIDVGPGALAAPDDTGISLVSASQNTAEGPLALITKAWRPVGDFLSEVAGRWNGCNVFCAPAMREPSYPPLFIAVPDQGHLSGSDEDSPLTPFLPFITISTAVTRSWRSRMQQISESVATADSIASLAQVTGAVAALEQSVQLQQAACQRMGRLSEPSKQLINEVTAFLEQQRGAINARVLPCYERDTRSRCAQFVSMAEALQSTESAMSLRPQLIDLVKTQRQAMQVGNTLSPGEAPPHDAELFKIASVLSEAGLQLARTVFSFKTLETDYLRGDSVQMAGMLPRLRAVRETFARLETILSHQQAKLEDLQPDALVADRALTQRVMQLSAVRANAHRVASRCWRSAVAFGQLCAERLPLLEAPGFALAPELREELLSMQEDAQYSRLALRQSNEMSTDQLMAWRMAVMGAQQRVIDIRAAADRAQREAPALNSFLESLAAELHEQYQQWATAYLELTLGSANSNGRGPFDLNPVAAVRRLHQTAATIAQAERWLTTSESGQGFDDLQVPVSQMLARSVNGYVENIFLAREGLLDYIYRRLQPCQGVIPDYECEHLQTFYAELPCLAMPDADTVSASVASERAKTLEHLLGNASKIFCCLITIFGNDIVE
jgi:hypothetical protein